MGGRPALELSAPTADVGLTSHFAVAETAVACVGTALLAAAGLAGPRNGRPSTVSLHPGHVGAAVVSERHFQVAGRPAGPGFAPLSRFWPTADGWIRTRSSISSGNEPTWSFPATGHEASNGSDSASISSPRPIPAWCWYS
jgi:hypothetical protein